MSISSMLVPVGLDPRDEKVLRYVCGLVGAVGAARCSSSPPWTRPGLEAPVVAAEVDRARERLAAMARLRDGRVLDGHRAARRHGRPHRGHPRARRAGRRRRHLLRHLGQVGRRCAVRRLGLRAPVRLGQVAHDDGPLRPARVRRRPARALARLRPPPRRPDRLLGRRHARVALGRRASRRGDRRRHGAARAPRRLHRGGRAQRRGA